MIWIFVAISIAQVVILAVLAADLAKQRRRLAEKEHELEAMQKFVDQLQARNSTPRSRRTMFG